MNVFNKVTLQSLKKNKTKTIVTIIGIILSAAMICAVTTFVSSIYNYALENAIYINGDWHGSETGVDLGTYRTICASDKVEKAVCAQQLGYTIAEGSRNEAKPYIYLLGASAKFKDMMPVHITSGEYPTSANEILLPDHLSYNGGAAHAIGDVLILELGERMRDGYSLGQEDAFYSYTDTGKQVMSNEELAIRETRRYTVVGFYERPGFEEYAAPGYTAITLADPEPMEGYTYEVWYKMKHSGELIDFIEENFFDSKINMDVMMFDGVSMYDSFDVMITSLAAIVIALIMFGSVSLIYNAFSISVSERTKQFGLLSSVGATKRQLRGMVLFEALAVSAIGIPLGILVGVGGIGVTLLIIGHKFESILGYPIPLRICVSVKSILIAIAIALLTVLISAWIPSKRATKVTAVEAIRQNLDISAKGRAVRTSKLTYKLFGLPGMLANKHYKRSRKKYRATVISLFMSIVLFVSASAFTDYLMESASGGFGTFGYDLRLLCNAEDFDGDLKSELLEEFSSADSVTDVAYRSMEELVVDIDKKYVTDEAQKQIKLYGDEDNADGDTMKINTTICFVNDKAFEELLGQYGLARDEYMDPEEPKCITVDGCTEFKIELEKYVTLNILKSGEYEFSLEPSDASFEGFEYSGQVTNEDGTLVNRYVSKDYPDSFIDSPADGTVIKSDFVIYEKPYFIEPIYGLICIYPESLSDEIFPGNYEGNLRYFFTSDNHSASYTAIKRILDGKGVSYNLINYAEQVESERNIITIIKVFSYGFIVLISLIAAANVFNTISTNIALRRREFAMLKSVGMTRKGFNRMMNFECLLYGSKALLFGVPVSCGITYLIYMAIMQGYEAAFRLPWTAIGIAVLSVFLVVGTTMMYSMSKIKKDNPIDALKNENL